MNGKTGIFPVCFVDIKVSLNGNNDTDFNKIAITLFDYRAQTWDDLDIKVSLICSLVLPVEKCLIKTRIQFFKETTGENIFLREHERRKKHMLSCLFQFPVGSILRTHHATKMYFIAITTNIIKAFEMCFDFAPVYASIVDTTRYTYFKTFNHLLLLVLFNPPLKNPRFIC